MRRPLAPSTPLLLIAAVVLSMAACTPAEPRQNSDGDHGTIVLGIPADLDSLNPYLSTQALNRDVAYKVFESLMVEQADFGQGPPTFLPALAREWEFSDDRRAVTFTLRDDAVWSDGVPITAEDVRFTWQASIHPDVAWISADVKQFITDVTVDSPYQVTFHFSRVYPYQLMDINDSVILPKHVWGAVPFADWRTSGLDREPVGSGPFRVARWVPNQSIELVASDSYYDPERPRVSRVVYRIMPDASAGLAQLLAGEIDFWERIPPQDLQRATAEPRVTVRRYEDIFYGFIAWNCERPIFAQAEVRQALTLGINRRRMVDDLFFGSAHLASGPIPPIFWAHNASIAPAPYDPVAASRLLADAGWVDSDGDGWLDRDGSVFRFELESNADAPYRQDMAVLVQEDLKKLGIDVQPVVLERNTFNARHREHDFDAFIGGWRLPTKIDLAVMFATSSRDAGVNFGSYSNPDLDRLLEQAARVEDYRDALPLFEAAQEILTRDPPYVFVYWRDRLVGFNSRIEGARPNPHSPLFNLDEWRIGTDPGGR